MNERDKLIEDAQSAMETELVHRGEWCRIVTGLLEQLRDREASLAGVMIDLCPACSEKAFAALERSALLRDIRAQLRLLYVLPQEHECWLRHPNARLGGRVPLDMIAAGEGKEVLNSLREITEGVYT